MPKEPAAAKKKEVLKDPKGGLTAAGRAHFKKTEGANLRPGVKGAADTPEKQQRKGSFLRRHFANKDAGPLQDEKARPTRHALSAAAWGEPVPETPAAVKKLADKGTALLDQARAAKEKKAAKSTPEKRTSKAATRKASSPPAKS